MLSKRIKDCPIVVGAYARLLVSNSVIKEAIEAKILEGKLMDRVDELSAAASSTTNIISKLSINVAADNKAADQATSKVGALKK